MKNEVLIIRIDNQADGCIDCITRGSEQRFILPDLQLCVEHALEATKRAIWADKVVMILPADSDEIEAR